MCGKGCDLTVCQRCGFTVFLAERTMNCCDAGSDQCCMFRRFKECMNFPCACAVAGRSCPTSHVVLACMSRQLYEHALPTPLCLECKNSLPNGGSECW